MTTSYLGMFNNPKKHDLERKFGYKFDALNQTIGAIYDLRKNYREMKNHKFKYMDDYYH